MCSSLCFFFCQHSMHVSRPKHACVALNEVTLILLGGIELFYITLFKLFFVFIDLDA